MRIHIHCLPHPLLESVDGVWRCRVRGPGPTIASVVGEVDGRVITDFAEGLKEAISGANRTVIVDLSRADFVSISGMQVLVDAQVYADRRGWRCCSFPVGHVRDVSWRSWMRTTTSDISRMCVRQLRPVVPSWRRTSISTTPCRSRGSTRQPEPSGATGVPVRQVSCLIRGAAGVDATQSLRRVPPQLSVCGRVVSGRRMARQVHE